MDDNSPNPNLRSIVAKYMVDRRINFYQSNVTLEERALTCRYATMINQAYPWTTGDYISYLTDDDDYYPRRLDIMCHLLDHNPEVNVVYGIQACYDDGFPDKLARRANYGTLKQAASFVDHNSVMHRRQIGLDVGLWDDRPEMWGHADAIFWHRLNLAGHDFYCVGEVTDRHRGSKDSAQSKMLNGRMPYEEW
jgi:spore maturation protein CgeD